MIRNSEYRIKLLLLGLVILFNSLCSVRNAYGKKLKEKPEYKLDSLIHYRFNEEQKQLYLFAKDFFTYDKTSQIASRHSFYYDSTSGRWDLEDKTEYTYTKNNKIDSESYYWYDYEKNQWGKMFKEKFYYTNNQLTEKFSYGGNEDFNIWGKNEKHSYKYNKDGLIIEERIFSFSSYKDEFTGEVINIDKQYKDNNLLSKETIYIFTDGKRQKASEINYVYNKDGVLQKKTVNEINHELLFDMENLVVNVETEEEFAISRGELFDYTHLVYNSKTKYNYNSEGLLIKKEKFKGDLTNWELEESFIKHYSDKNNLIAYGYNIGTSTNDFADVQLVLDEKYDVKKNIQPKKGWPYDMSISSKVKEMHQYSKIEGKQVLYHKTFFYYSEINMNK